VFLDGTAHRVASRRNGRHAGVFKHLVRAIPADQQIPPGRQKAAEKPPVEATEISIVASVAYGPQAQSLVNIFWRLPVDRQPT